jgi:hypothetical protein
LEGQVAAIGAGVLSAAEGAQVLEALRASALWRPDLGTYLLYPDRSAQPFLARGVLSSETMALVPELEELVADDELGRLLRVGSGAVRFAPGLTDITVLDARIEALLRDVRLSPAARARFERARGPLREAYERTFHHARFTGRSGSFFAYEGLGSVYWHMVSKLRLAVAEVIDAEHAAGRVDTPASRSLTAAYRELRRGLGMDSQPAEYGAMATDPYSHTPANGGARQPGMTGQVKEDLLARRLELGVRFEDGRVTFRRPWLHPDSSARFSVCGTPVVVESSAESAPGAPSWLEVELTDGAVERVGGLALSVERSRALLARDGTIRSLRVLHAASLTMESCT